MISLQLNNITFLKNALEKVLWMESDRMGWLLSTVNQAALNKEQDAVQNEKRLRVDNRPYGHENYVIVKNIVKGVRSHEHRIMANFFNCFSRAFTLWQQKNPRFNA